MSKRLNRNLTKEDIQMASKQKTICQHYVSLGNFKLKQQRNQNGHNLKHGEDQMQQECSVIANGNANGTDTLEDSLVVSYKIRHTLTI